MTGRNSRRLWEDMVRLTNASSLECVRSLRMVLFIWLQADRDNPLRRQVRRVGSAIRPLLPMRTLGIPQAKRGQLVFCFAHQTPANMQNLLPVARAADRRGVLGGIVSAGDFERELAEFSGRIPIVTAQSLISQLSIVQRHKIAVESLRTFREIFEMLSAYDAHLTWCLFRNAGTVLDETVRSLQLGVAFRNLLEAWSPSCVVSTSDLWPLEYQFAYQASSLRIPSVVIQHGISDHSWWPFQADLFVAWGDIFKEKMTELGVPLNRLAIGGMPASDQVFQRQRALDRNGVREGVMQDPPVCLILSHSQGRVVEPELFERFKEVLSETIQLTPNVRWKVKLHPSEEDSFYRELDDKIFKRLEIYPKSTSLVEAVEGADVVTTLFSASGLEAMMMERPVIVPVFSPRGRELAWWPDLGGGVYAQNADEFHHHLVNLLTVPQNRLRQIESQRSFLKRSFANPGCAAEVIVDLITNTSLLENSQEVLSGGAAV
jgi:hypothetical protein